MQKSSSILMVQGTMEGEVMNFGRHREMRADFPQERCLIRALKNRQVGGGCFQAGCSENRRLERERLSRRRGERG